MTWAQRLRRVFAIDIEICQRGSTPGPGSHLHAQDDDVFYVLEGVMSFLVGDEWIDAPQGTFVLAPAGVTHAFENQGAVRAGVLNFYTGPFEAEMPSIVDWFSTHPPEDTA
jgi:mannose-6-phosphate isomerase-like protein (cupin superfamily)